MVNDSNRDDPSFDIGFQGLASLGDPGIGPVDIGSVPNTFGSMPGKLQKFELREEYNNYYMGK